MYQSLIFCHSITRWLVLISLLYAIYRAYRGWRSDLPFSKADNSIRHWTATIAHIQLVLGIILYTQSAMVSYFWENTEAGVSNNDIVFFSVIHSLLMLTAIVVITIGSALAKRRTADRDKFKTMFIWFGLALLIIFIAVPWPFSPLVSRPYFR